VCKIFLIPLSDMWTFNKILLPNGRVLTGSEVHGCCLFLDLAGDVQRFLVEKEMWVLSIPANSNPEFKTHAKS
jgi:hypothetical protein